MRFKKRSKELFAKLLATLLIVLPIRYSIERLKPFQEFRTKPPWMIQIEQFEDAPLPDKIVLFNATHPIETMFHLNCVAYSGIPSMEDRSLLRREGYEILILDEVPSD